MTYLVDFMKLFCSETSSFVWTIRHHLHNIEKSTILADNALRKINQLNIISKR